MSDFLLPIPEDALAEVRLPRDRMASELRKELALRLYREGLLPGAGACRLAGMEKAAFQYLLGERGVCQQLREADLNDDLENGRAWNRR